MTRTRFSEKFQSVSWVFPIFLVSLIYILDTRYFSSPPLYSDDWAVLVGRYVSGNLHIWDWSVTRHLGLSLFVVLASVVGLKLQYFYLANFLFIFFSAILLYLVIKRAFPRYPGLPLPVALVYLVYPVIYTRTWLIITSYHFALCLYLGVVLLLMDFIKSGRIWLLLVAFLLFLFSLVFYEGGLGVVLLAAILLAERARSVSIKRRLAVLSILLAGGVFIVWRTYLQHNLINVPDAYYEQLDISPLTLLSRYAAGLFVFIFNWVGPLFGSLGRIKYVLFLVAGILLSSIFLAFLPRLIKSAKSDTSFPWAEREGTIKSLAVVFLVGGLFWAAGYIPVIALRGPSFDGDNSRGNLFSILGASLSLVTVLYILFTLIARSANRVEKMVTLAIIPFLLIGTFYQLWSQNERFKAWNDQRQFWLSMFETVPGLKDDSDVVIVIPGYDDYYQFQVLPFVGHWEANNALKTLYNNPTVLARYYYLDFPHEGENVIDKNWDYSDVVFVYYDPAGQSVEVIEDPKKQLSLSLDLTGYAPEKRIIERSPLSQSYRWLVK